MKWSRAVHLFLLCSLVPLMAFAQGKPTQPGPPSTTPQVVVDSTGKTVGDVIEVVNGLAKAFVKYVLANGNFVVLNAVSAGLTGSVSAQSEPFPDPGSAKVFFMTPDCGGNAYFRMPTGGVDQVTAYQSATIVGAIPSQLPPPVIDPNCPPPFGDLWLYTAVSGACPLLADPGRAPVTFQSFYGFPLPPNPSANGALCVAPAGGITFGSPSGPPNQVFAQFVVYSPTENLSLKFKAPFSVK